MYNQIKMCMKTRKLNYVWALAAMLGFMFSGCSKDNSSTTSPITNAQVSQMQNSDTQDTIADKADQDVDNTADEIQNSDYQPANVKDGSTSGSVTITVDHPDSTTFPKVISIVFDNYADSLAEESFVRNGEIDITVNASDPKHRLVTRDFTYKNYAITTDSTSIIINGTRDVQRVKDSLFVDIPRLRARLGYTANITANLSYSIVTTGSTDTATFTRVVDRVRTGSGWFQAAITNMHHLMVRHLAAKDSLTITGTVTGVNEKGLDYSKTITTPLQVISLLGTPVLTAGAMTYAGGSGSTAFSYSITYQEDLPNHPFKTLVTVTNLLTGKIHSFDRKFGRRFLAW